MFWTLIRYMICQYFPILGGVFSLLCLCPWIRQSFNLGDIQLTLFLLLPALLASYLRIQCQIQGHKDWPL